MKKSVRNLVKAKKVLDITQEMYCIINLLVAILQKHNFFLFERVYLSVFRSTRAAEHCSRS